MTQSQAATGRAAHPDHNSAREGSVDLYIRVHAVSGDDLLVVSRDFGSELEATQAITRALDVRGSLVLSRASFNRESAQSVVVINLANVVAVRVSGVDSAATGQYL